MFAQEFNGRSVYDVFESIDPVPIASGSLAQVHKARLWSGEHVSLAS